jgi:hypothetical protein
LSAGPAAPSAGLIVSGIGVSVSNSYPYPTPELINKEDPSAFSDQELTDYNSAIKIIGDGGTPGLQGNTTRFLYGTVSTFDKLMTDIDAMVKEYDSAEELSTLSAGRLEEVRGRHHRVVGGRVLRRQSG